MKHLAIFLISAVLSHASAFASSVLNAQQIICTADEAISSFENQLTLACAGDFSLMGGSISTDSALVIRADGALTLQDLNLSASTIELRSSNGPIIIGHGVFLSTHSLLLSGGQTDYHLPLPITPNQRLDPITIGHDREVSLGSGGIISVLTPVPEPSSIALIGVGMLAVLVNRRQLRHRKRQPLHAVAAEVDLGSGVVAVAFQRDDHALAKLGVEHALPCPQPM